MTSRDLPQIGTCGGAGEDSRAPEGQAGLGKPEPMAGKQGTRRAAAPSRLTGAFQEGQSSLSERG